MARLDYAAIDAPEIQDLIGRIVEQRGELLHLYQMLLHSPPIAEGWLRLMTAVRQETVLPGALRELAIIRIALINGAPYEAEQHRPIALGLGCTPSQIDALGRWDQEKGLFDDAERTVLALTDSMTLNSAPDPLLWRALQDRWSAREIVELVVVIASYNMVSRVLSALNIESQDST